MTVHGHVEPGFEPVREVFEKQFAEGLNVGGSVAVNLRGKPVVNLWGGTTAPDGGEPWREDTMTIVYSTTKGLTATCLHVLADTAWGRQQQIPGHGDERVARDVLRRWRALGHPNVPGASPH